MNNPFLSDRNIFSKVVNPLKKKEDSKPEGTAPQPPVTAPKNPTPPDRTNPLPVDRANPNPNTYNPPDTYNPNRANRFQQQPTAKSTPFAPQQKLTFGVPTSNEPEKRQTIDRQYFGNPRPETYDQEESESSETHEIYNYKKGDSIRFPQSASKPLGGEGGRAGISSRPTDILSSPQDHKFEEFRRNNQLSDCSPINPQVRMGDSEFLNIDALGDDLNRFLAESKNQQELCKILGIQRNNKPPNQKPNQKNEYRGVDKNERSENRGFNERIDNKGFKNTLIGSKGANDLSEKKEFNDSLESRGFNQRADSRKYNEQIENSRGFDNREDFRPVNADRQRNPFQKPENPITKNTQISSQPQPKAQPQETLPKVPTIFSKDRKIENGKTDQYIPAKVSESPSEHVPTFNFGALQQEHSTISREDDEAPNFSSVHRVKIRGGDASKASQGSEVEPLQVFNYSSTVGGSRETLEDSIRREMMDLSINGRYRTFLSASEKITTVKYKMEPL